MGGGAAAGKHIFLTSISYNGNLGGLAGADSKCSTVAAGANLPGSWKAWLSDSSTSAIDRIDDVGPWFLVNGTKAFNNKANLASTPLEAVNVTEQGHAVFGAVWTGTNSSGVKGNYNCRDWSSAGIDDYGGIGEVDAKTEWTQRAPAEDECNNSAPLYCIEQ
jgi:hypothetical protein